MRLQVTRLGQQLEVEASDEDRIAFPEGIVGFESDTEFVLLPDPEGGILWLHSLSNPEVAFAALDPFLIWTGYDVTLSDADAEALDLTAPADAQVLVIITPREDPAEITANLRAPIVINQAQRSGRQVILQDSPYPIRTPVLAALAQVAEATESMDAGRPRAEAVTPETPALEGESERADETDEAADTLGRAAA